MTSGSLALPPRVYAEALPAWLDGETWGFTLTITDPATGAPMELTGSRLYAAFVAINGAPIGVCDSDAGDDSLGIASGTGGQATFRLPVIGRTWDALRLTAGGIDTFRVQTAALGDLYRKVGASDWQAICRIRIPVMPTTGKPPQS